MKNFSELDNNALATERDNIIADVVARSGLTKERVVKLYESVDASHIGDVAKIKKTFNDMLTPVKVSNKDFKDLMLSLQTDIDAAYVDVDKREKLTKKIIGVVDTLSTKTNDTPKVIELISFILSEKNEKFDKVAQKIDFGKDIKKLFESQEIDLSKTSIKPFHTYEVNNLNAREDKKLYEGLKEILARNNKRWGYNYHLDNVYNTIVSFLDNEIRDLSVYDTVHSSNDEFHARLIDEIVHGKQLDPMYRSVSYLKPLIPDLQSLVFDLMALINTYMENNKGVMQYFAENNYKDYYNAMRSLYSMISSSRYNSKICSVYTPEKGQSTPATDYCLFMDNIWVDYKKVELWHNPISTRSANDMVHIIFSCQYEFPLRTRKIINAYFTHTMNLIKKCEKKIMQHNNPNIMSREY